MLKQTSGVTGEYNITKINTVTGEETTYPTMYNHLTANGLKVLSGRFINATGSNTYRPLSMGEVLVRNSKTTKREEAALLQLDSNTIENSSLSSVVSRQCVVDRDNKRIGVNSTYRIIKGFAIDVRSILVGDSELDGKWGETIYSFTRRAFNTQGGHFSIFSVNNIKNSNGADDVISLGVEDELVIRYTLWIYLNEIPASTTFMARGVRYNLSLSHILHNDGSTQNYNGMAAYTVTSIRASLANISDINNTPTNPEYYLTYVKSFGSTKHEPLNLVRLSDTGIHGRNIISVPQEYNEFFVRNKYTLNGTAFSDKPYLLRTIMYYMFDGALSLNFNFDPPLPMDPDDTLELEYDFEFIPKPRG